MKKLLLLVALSALPLSSVMAEEDIENYQGRVEGTREESGSTYDPREPWDGRNP